MFPMSTIHLYLVFSMFQISAQSKKFLQICRNCSYNDTEKVNWNNQMLWGVWIEGLTTSFRCATSFYITIRKHQSTQCTETDEDHHIKNQTHPLHNGIFSDFSSFVFHPELCWTWSYSWAHWNHLHTVLLRTGYFWIWRGRGWTDCCGKGKTHFIRSGWVGDFGFKHIYSIN